MLFDNVPARTLFLPATSSGHRQQGTAQSVPQLCISFAIPRSEKDNDIGRLCKQVTGNLAVADKPRDAFVTIRRAVWNRQTARDKPRRELAKTAPAHICYQAEFGCYTSKGVGIIRGENNTNLGSSMHLWNENRVTKNLKKDLDEFLLPQARDKSTLFWTPSLRPVFQWTYLLRPLP